MKISVATFTSTLLVSLAPISCIADDCDQDDCLRAVAGTFPPVDPSKRKADCSNYLLTTVTPTPRSSTVTITISHDARPTSAVGTNGPVTAQETLAPTAIPTYAACGASAYASACSCWGVDAVTRTAPTPVSTVSLFVCPSGLSQCGERCVDLQSDQTHCGSCGNKCTEGAICEYNKCKFWMIKCSNPWACGHSLEEYYTCLANANATCFTTAEGGDGVCGFHSGNCGKSCEKDADCGEQRRCLVSTCCRGGTTCTEEGELKKIAEGAKNDL